jgi:hypothetical protein
MKRKFAITALITAITCPLMTLSSNQNPFDDFETNIAEYSKDRIFQLEVDGIRKNSSVENPNSKCCSSGSAFIISKTGLAITSKHLLAEIKDLIPGYHLNLYDYSDPNTWRKTYDFKLVSIPAIDKDDQVDIAVIQIINPNNIVFSPLGLGNSREISQGERLLGSGFVAENPNPSPTLTDVGILKDRKSLYKWDTGIEQNFGQSGGPVFDKNGLVVGVMSETFKLSSGETSNIIVPIDLAKSHLKSTDYNDTTPDLSSFTGESFDSSFAIDTTYEFSFWDRPFFSSFADYKKTITCFKNSKSGYLFDDRKTNLIINSANQMSDYVFKHNEKSINLTYKLRSGPWYDQRRGWLLATIFTHQVRKFDQHSVDGPMKCQ